MIAKTISPAITVNFIGDAIKFTDNPIIPQITYKSLAQPFPFNILKNGVRIIF